MSERDYPTFTVSQISAEIGARLKSLDKIILSGEISGWRRYPSGHAYFTLKDEASQISCVMFSACLTAVVARIGDVLKDGAKVELFGSVGVYANRGNYQFVARSARLVGVGDLMRRYLELKAKLESEGLFDQAKKRPLPFLPRRIGIVTSEAGAVIHDMCTVLTRRFPALEIRLYPSLVQGVEAPAMLVCGIEYFNALSDWRADLLIVARGGGSFEDLFCFNDETLVRTLAASSIPTISAVGHETDYTLCDFVADRRAGTPSIAAEIAVPVLAELKTQLSDAALRLSAALRGRGEWFAQRLDQLSDSMAASLAMSLSRIENRLARLEPRLAPALAMCLQRETARLEKASAKLDVLSPFAVLDRGYSLTTTMDGLVVKDASDLSVGQQVKTRFAKGAVEVSVSSID